jgi:hypothetical protein
MAKVKATQKKAKTESGAEIDPQVADALASEAERGHDLAREAVARYIRS